MTAAKRGAAFMRRAPARSPICFAGAFSQATQMDAEKFCAQFLPDAVPADFSALEIPLTVMATDLHRRAEAPLTAGPLRPALAASIAIPGMFRPVLMDGRVLIDGGTTNPLPFDQACRARRCHRRGRRIRHSDGGAQRHAEHLGKPLHTILVMGSAILAANIAPCRARLVIRPNVGIFRSMDFSQASSIIRAAEAAKTEMKEKLGALLGGVSPIRAGAL